MIDFKFLIASKDKRLTNGKVCSSIGGKIYLGANDSVDNWYEITEEEYNEKFETEEQV